MLDVSRAVDNIFVSFRKKGWDEIPENRFFFEALVAGIYKEMIDNGDIIIKKHVDVDFTVGEMKFKKGEITMKNDFVSDGETTTTNIVEGNIEIEEGKMLFTKVTKEEYRIV